MNILAVDSASEQLVVCAKVEDKMAFRISHDGSKLHNSRLLTFVEQVCDELCVKVADFDAFACVVGAGSFTGIRLGVSAIKAMAFAANKPTIALTSFESIAYNIQDKKFVVTIDARHDNYYAAIFENNWTNCKEMKCFTAEELAQMNLPIYEKTTYSDPQILLSVAEQYGKNGKFAEPNPLYLKKSQAERERDGE